MYICVLVHQEYPSGVYQPGTTSLEPKVILIQIYFNISYSLFSSSDTLTLELLLPTSVTPINITILDNPISSNP